MFSEGDTIGAYELIRRLGGGAFGEVWLGRHDELGLERAIKTPTDPDYVRQLRQEGKIQAQVRHPNIVETVDLNTRHDPPYFVMEYVEGTDLRKRLKADGKLPVAEVLEILRQILDALICAHSQGVLHRDLKPENILMTPDGRVKVADFGLGKVQADVAQSLLLSGSMMSSQGVSISGTFQYMSPEQQSGKDADQRDDVYSVGIIGCELLTGRRPAGAGIARAMARCGIDRAVGDLFEKAGDDAEYRYESAGEMRAAIVSLINNLPVGRGGASRGGGPASGSRAGPASGRRGKRDTSLPPRGRGTSGDEAIQPEPTPPELKEHDGSAGVALPSIKKAATAVLLIGVVTALGAGLAAAWMPPVLVDRVIIVLSQVMAALIFGRTFQLFRRMDLLWIGILLALRHTAFCLAPEQSRGLVLLSEAIPAIGLSLVISRRLPGSVFSHAVVQIPLWLGVVAATSVYGYFIGVPFFFAGGLVFATGEALVIYLVAREGMARADGRVATTRSAKRWPVMYVGVVCIVVAPVLAGWWLLCMGGYWWNEMTLVVLLSTIGLAVGGVRLLRRPCSFAWLQVFASAFLSCGVLIWQLRPSEGTFMMPLFYGNLTPLLPFWPVLLLPGLVPILRRMRVST